jgi:Cu+-exporting ATPase
VIFGFTLGVVFAGSYYGIQRLCRVRMFSDTLSRIHLWGWNAIIVAAAVSLLSGYASLCTGDQPDAARLAAGSAALDHVWSEQTPESKVERIRQLRREGRRVLMAGDGVNDAAALGAADLGLAMHRGSDVTLQAADLIVRSSRIRENLGFAVLYNAAAIPLAVVGWLDPLHAAIAMSASSVIVTGNAIRLLRWEPR